MMKEFEDPIKKRDAAYEFISKAENIDYRAKIWFERPPYHMRFLKSWTTGREEGYVGHREREDNDHLQWAE